ncbi:hypothetical protein GCM10010423_65360 [Streptomyces levis]|uniref:JAB domain-containing protein n=1 Tax=Streptomyces levis TaxID=285566 RepID=A0ABN3P127_9ACTN
MTDLQGLSRFRGISREQCGLIIRKKDGNLTVAPVKNSSRDPEKYLITEESFRKVHSWLGPGERIVGFLHTHLEHHSTEPSDADWEGAANNPGWLHAIYKPSTGQITWYVYEAD